MRKTRQAEKPAARDLPRAEELQPLESIAAPEAQPVIESDVVQASYEPVEVIDIQPSDEVSAEPPVVETEILHDLVEAAEIQSADSEIVPEPEPVEAEIVEAPVEEPSVILTEEEVQAEPTVAETEILHELVDAAQSVDETILPEPVEADIVLEPALERVDWQIAEAEPDQVILPEPQQRLAADDPSLIDTAPEPMPERVEPDEATAFAFAEADASPKPEEAAAVVEPAETITEEPSELSQSVGELPPADVAHIRTIIAEGRHWPDEATIAPDTKSGEIARSLLDIMSMPQSGSLPQERALAADTLLRLIPRLPDKSILDLVERVSVMDAPSQLLVRRLINDPRIEVSAPLLERGTVVSDRDLIAVIEENDPAKQRLIARRRGISPALSEALILSGDDETITNLLRNGQASFSIEAFDRLLLLAVHKSDLQAPLATRPDLPAPVAFELFWCLPAELRRYVLSRFLTHSETINKILRLSQVTGTSAIAKPENSDLAILGEVIANRFLPEAAQLLAKLANISLVSAAKIVADRGKEPLTVAMKAAGLSRSQFETLINRLLEKDEDEPLKRIFDQLSFNKARVLLTYWDWAASNTGPYAKAAA